MNNAQLVIRLGENSKIHLSKNIRLAGVIRITAGDNASIYLGDNGQYADTNFSCAKGGRLVLENKCSIHKQGTVSVGENATLEFGEQCTFRFNPFIVAHQNTSILLGNDCMAAANVHIRSDDGHSIYDLAEGRKLNSDSKSRKIVVGNHVW